MYIKDGERTLPGHLHHQFLPSSFSATLSVWFYIKPQIVSQVFPFKPCLFFPCSCHNMESVAPFTAVTRPAKSYTKQQWEEQRDIITLQYLDKATSFQELRSQLAQQRSFYPR